MTVETTRYETDPIMTQEITDKAARLTNAILRLTGMLSDRLWTDPAYDDMKDRFTLLALVDASLAAARELEELVLEQ